jgi:rRNA-processing protein FCF1
MSDYKLSLLSKRLRSGKCQIKFIISNAVQQEMYGYMLTESGTTLKEVVKKIENQVKIRDRGEYYHSHLYNLAMKQQNEEILIFKS